MNNFKSGGGGGFKKGGSRSKFEGKKSFGGAKKQSGGHGRSERTSGPTAQLFSAKCSECGNKCDVPFKPSNDKPVYCSACFGAKKAGNETRSSDKGGDRAHKGSFNNDRPDYTKLPREDRPARHNADRGRSSDGIAELKQQITGLELKLNRILEIVNPPMPSKKVPLVAKEQVVAKVAKKAPAKKAEAKVAKKAPAKKAEAKVAAKAAPKKVAAKKVVAKAPAKKVVAKAPAKKAVAKVVAKAAPKKVAAKAPAKKVVKKAKK
jgi:CxxC-x17-CxxC domain-containing protein